MRKRQAEKSRGPCRKKAEGHAEKKPTAQAEKMFGGAGRKKAD